MNFQYPRSDRAHCNSGNTAWIHPEASAFSILGRIEPTATGGRGAPPRPVFPLSVSSVGSSPLQRRGAPAGPGAEPGFQYPRSDRAHCNGSAPGTPGPRPPLSVSSVGSSPLQQGDGDEVERPLRLLSVSSVGSSPLQPSSGSGGSPSTWSFQYPRSDRAHCNREHRTHTDLSLSFFQYPRSDRAHCNSQNRQEQAQAHQLSVSSVGSSPLQHRRHHHLGPRRDELSVSSVGSSPLQPGGSPRGSWRPSPFSILGRIEPTATPVGRPRRDRPQGPFSILGRIEPTATGCPGGLLPTHRGSFSILGRIEPTATGCPPPILRGLVAAVGGTCVGAGSFQYPRSDRAHCNTIGSWGRALFLKLSVSSVGSSPLQRRS